MLVAMSLPSLAQNLPDAPTPKPQSVVDLPLIPLIPVPQQKDHNFFWNKINTPVFIAQAGGAFFMARELNGNASNFTTPSFWHRYLPNAYRESFAVMVAGDGIAYGFHKASFKHHKLIERGVLFATAAGLYITAERNRKAYNQSDCNFGLQQFCH